MVYVILIAAAIIFWLIVVDRPVVKITFSDGHITKVKGHLPAKFKHNLVEIGDKNSFNGELKVYQQRAGAKLVFSKQVPKSVQQRIRNVFPHQGFKAKGDRKAR